MLSSVDRRSFVPKRGLWSTRRKTCKGRWFPVRVSAGILARRTENVQNEARKLVTEKISPLGWEHITLIGTYRWDLAAPPYLQDLLNAHSR